MSETLPLLTGPLDSAEDFTLTAVRHRGRVLLGKKAWGYGRDMLVLPGGKTRYYLGDDGIHSLSGPDDARREVREETGVQLSGVTWAGMLDVLDGSDEKQVQLYTGVSDSVSTIPSPELPDLQWYEGRALPYERMPADYRLWLPHVLAGRAVTGFFEKQKGRIRAAQVFAQQQEPLGRLEKVVDFVDLA